MPVGRDQLSENWPKLYTVEQQNELPAEILARISEGADFGWPSCYFDAMQTKQVLAPEYGGDGGKAVGDCAMKGRPDVAFPAHWAPDALAFYAGTAFPAKYQGGAFVSFHGSWNRNPKQAGYLVAFVPFAGGKPGGTMRKEFAVAICRSGAAVRSHEGRVQTHGSCRQSGRGDLRFGRCERTCVAHHVPWKLTERRARQ